MTTSRLTPAPGDQPPGYTEVLYWKLNERTSRTVWLQVLSFALFILSALFFFNLPVWLGRAGSFQSFGLWEVLGLLLGVPLTIVLHELLHGLAMRAFGARPQYGVMWKQLVFYATAPGYAFRRDAYLVVILAPLLGISLLAVLGLLVLTAPGWIFLLALCAAANAAGATGDLWTAGLMLRYPPHAYVMDERDGVRIFLPAAS